MESILPYALLLLFSWMTYMDRERLRDAWSSRRWTATKAIVTAIRDHVTQMETVSQYSGSNLANLETRNYVFLYSVDGVVYESSRYSFESESRSDLPLFEKGQEITIYYDPENPRRATIKQGFTVISLWVPLMNFAMLVFVLIKASF